MKYTTYRFGIFKLWIHGDTLGAVGNLVTVSLFVVVKVTGLTRE